MLQWGRGLAPSQSRASERDLELSIKRTWGHHYHITHVKELSDLCEHSQRGAKFIYHIIDR